MDFTRRHLLAGGTASSLLTLFGVGQNTALAADSTTRDVLVVVFQRGAADWLQMLAPAGDADYVRARPGIRVQANNANGLGSLNGVDLFLHPNASDLRPIYDAGNLAFVHAAGLLTNDRSHFTCQDNMERGVADGDPRLNTGWLARHINAIGAGLPILSTLSSSTTTPASLLGNSQAIAVGNVSSFNVSGGETNSALLRKLSTGDTNYERQSRETLDAITTIQAGLKAANTATANNAGYPGGSLAGSLRSLATFIKMNVGLSVATVDTGGWDMHNNLVNEFAERTSDFSRSIAAFWRDIAAFQGNVTLVTMTEFGRRLQQNANLGTDHGSAAGMIVLSGNVKGGKIYGSWPGLAPNQLNSGDLRVTTDYRQVLAEILMTRRAEQNFSSVFPTLKYAPLGLMKTPTA